MLSNPHSTGWTRISIGDWSNRASYLTDVPMNILDAFLNKRYGPVAVDFDAEGWEYIVVCDDYITYVIDYDYNSTIEYMQASDNDSLTLRIIEIDKEELVRDFINDIESILDEWICWMLPDTKSEILEREQELRKKLEILKNMYK